MFTKDLFYEGKVEVRSYSNRWSRRVLLTLCCITRHEVLVVPKESVVWLVILPHSVVWKFFLTKMLAFF